MRVLPPALIARRMGHPHDLEASLLAGFGPLEGRASGHPRGVRPARAPAPRRFATCQFFRMC